MNIVRHIFYFKGTFMKYLYVTIKLLLMSNYCWCMQPAKQEDEFDKARTFVYSKKGLSEKYHQASLELVEAIICKDKTRISKVIDSFPKEGRSFLLNSHVDHHISAYDYRLKEKYPQLYAQNDKLPFHISPLAMAVRTGDQSVIELLHAYKVRMDFMCDRKCILEHATEHAPALIPFLVACGANVHAQNEAALFAAARQNTTDALEHLLVAGAKVNARLTHPDLIGLTPLHVAGNNGKYEAAKFLLENGAEVDATDSQGCTPLHWCTMNANSHIASLLLEYGADITKRDTKGNSVIEFLTFKFQSLDAFNFIKKGAPYPQSKEDQDLIFEGMQHSISFTSAAYKKFVPAIITGDTPTALTTINEAVGNELNDVSYTMDKYTFLHWATIRNNLAVVNELLNRRMSESSLLRTAAIGIPLISRAVQHPVQIDAQDSHGRTPLMWAARLGLKPIYDVLKSAGADENIRDRKGNNAFMLAALGGHMGLALGSKPSLGLQHSIQDK